MEEGAILERVLVRLIMHAKFISPQSMYVTHMLASYMTVVQISRLLKPHAHFVNSNNVIISSTVEPAKRAKSAFFDFTGSYF